MKCFVCGHGDIDQVTRYTDPQHNQVVERVTCSKCDLEIKMRISERDYMYSENAGKLQTIAYGIALADQKSLALEKELAETKEKLASAEKELERRDNTWNDTLRSIAQISLAVKGEIPPNEQN
jgi:acetylglutamate kinase